MNDNTAGVLIAAIIASWGAIASIARAWRDRGRKPCPRCKAVLDAQTTQEIDR